MEMNQIHSSLKILGNECTSHSGVVKHITILHESTHILNQKETHRIESDSKIIEFSLESPHTLENFSSRVYMC